MDVRQTLQISHYIAKTVCVLCIVLAAMLIAAPQSHGQELPDDSLRDISQEFPLGDSLNIADSIVMPPPPVFYPDFYEPAWFDVSASESPESRTELTGNRHRMYFTVRDVLKSRTDFYALKFGPMGQTYGMSHLGLPPYMMSIHPDHAGAYMATQLPPAGIADLRLYGMERFDFVTITTDGSISPSAMVNGCRKAFNKDDAESEVQIFKGDYSYANTDVVFRQNVGNRFGWGFNVGVEQSRGYRTQSRKYRENYNAEVRYKLTPDWQMTTVVRFMNVNDTVSQLGRWTSVFTERETVLKDLNVSLRSSDTSGALVDVRAGWQSYQEKVRSKYFFMRQLVERFRVNGSLAKGFERFTTRIRPEIQLNRVTFDPGYEYYTRAVIDADIASKKNSRLDWMIFGNYLFDWGDASRIGGGGSVGLDLTTWASLHATGKFSHIPPSEAARFLKPCGFDFDGDGAQEYNQGGDPTLKPTRQEALSAGLTLQSGVSSLSIDARIAQFSDLVIWQSYEGEQGGLYQSESRDADQVALTAIAATRLLNMFNLRASYSYARLREADTERDQSLMPRHNVFTSLSWKQELRKPRLLFFPTIEAEYHSENHTDYINRVMLDDYLAINGRISVRVKSFNFYYNMENIFNKTHQTVYGYPMNRRVWWGIRWIFLN